MFNRYRFSFLFLSGLTGFEPPSSLMFLCVAGQYASDLQSVSKNSAEFISIVAFSNNPRLIHLLNEQGASFINCQVKPDAKPGLFEIGDTALIIACRLGNTQGVSILLSWGADCNIKNARGYSALHVAVESNHIDCIKLLLTRWYIRINEQNNLGDTSLSMACKINNTAAVELFLERGANQLITNFVGHSAYHEALLRKFNDCQQLLLKPPYLYNPLYAYWYAAVNKVVDTIAPKHGIGKEISYVCQIYILNCYVYAFGFTIRSIYFGKEARSVSTTKEVC